MNNRLVAIENRNLTPRDIHRTEKKIVETHTVSEKITGR
jgi:hypothetical protein